MTEFLILTKEELQRLIKNEPVRVVIGRPIILCSREYFEQQKEDTDDRTETDSHR